MRSLDQARNISDGGALVSFKFKNAYHWIQGREGIRCDFGMRGGNFPNQGRLAGVRVTDETDVGNLSQLQKEVAFFARLPFGELARRSIGRTFEMGVPFPACSAPAQNQFLIFLVQISNQFTIGGQNYRLWWRFIQRLV